MTPTARMSTYLDRNLATLRQCQPFDGCWLDGALAGPDGELQTALLDGQSAAEISRWLDEAIGESSLTHVAVVGAARRAALDLLFERSPGTRVMVIEPSGAVLTAFLAEADWTARIESGRLFVVGAGASATAAQLWTRFGSVQPAPLLVNPRVARRASRYAATARAVYRGVRRDSTADIQRQDVRRSMLHADVLLMLEQAASAVLGAIVEIGAYVGGGTAAIGRGLRSTGHRVPFVSIELGGAYPDHPYLPSSDILGDLMAFLRAEAVADRVHVLNGYSRDPDVHRRALEHLAGHPIGLLTIDADGRVFHDFELYLPACRPGALVMVDDYHSALAPEKAIPTRACVDACVEAGLFTSLGVCGWGTWFGTLSTRVTASEIAALHRSSAG